MTSKTNLDLLYELSRQKNEDLHAPASRIHLNAGTSMATTTLSKAIHIANEIGVSDLHNFIQGSQTADYISYYFVQTQYSNNNDLIHLSLDSFRSLDEALDFQFNNNAKIMDSFGTLVENNDKKSLSVSCYEEIFYLHSQIFMENIPIEQPENLYFIVDYHRFQMNEDSKALPVECLAAPVNASCLKNTFFSHLPIEQYASLGFFDSEIEELGKRYPLSDIIPASGAIKTLYTDDQSIEQYYKTMNLRAVSVMRSLINGREPFEVLPTGEQFFDLENGIVIMGSSKNGLSFYDFLSKYQFQRKYKKNHQ